MNYIKHLTGFFEKVSTDFDLNPTHISLYMAIFQLWNLNRFQNPISISRDELMRISKIASTATYHKCLKDLTQKGYVNYRPSYNPFKGSLLEVCNLDFYTKPVPKKELKKLKNQSQTPLEINQVDEHVNEQPNEQVIKQVLNKHQTSSKQALNKLPIIYKHNKTYTNIINLDSEQAKKNKNENEIVNEFLDSKTQKQKKKLREKKETNKTVIPRLSSRACHPEHVIPSGVEGRGTRDAGVIPNQDEVKNFFLENSFSPLESEKFFNYYSSIGWLIGGKTKMKDWKAAARNWMLNAQKFNTKARHPELGEGPKPNHLHTPNSKNYAEPL